MPPLSPLRPFPVGVAPPKPYSHRYSPYKRPRTMLQRKLHGPCSVVPLSDLCSRSVPDAWHVVATSDPLADSDEDDEDEHVRQDHGPCLLSHNLLSLTRACSRPSRSHLARARQSANARARRRPPHPSAPWPLARRHFRRLNPSFFFYYTSIIPVQPHGNGAHNQYIILKEVARSNRSCDNPTIECTHSSPTKNRMRIRKSGYAREDRHIR